jgi:hypothetical protein
LRRSIEEDFARLPEVIRRAQQTRPPEEEPPEQPQQLNLL